MSYVDKNLVPNERVIYETRLHWIVMLGNIVAGILLAAAGAFALYYAATLKNQSLSTVHAMDGAGIALLILAVLAIVLGVVRRNATEMAVTNRRLIVKRGLVSWNTIEMLLNKVESIEVNQSLAGRMMGYGTIRMIGTGGTREPFPRMAHPLEFRNQAQQQIEKHAQTVGPEQTS